MFPGKDPVTDPARTDAHKADLQAILVSLDNLNVTNSMPFLNVMSALYLIVLGKINSAVETPIKEHVERWWTKWAR